MLQKIREKVSGWVAGIILAVLAVVFAVWGIDFTFSARSVAAKVNGEEVPIEPVRRAFQDQLSRFQQALSQDVPEPVQQEIRRAVVENFVRRELLEQRVRDEGYRVGDEALDRHIRAIPAFQVGGEFDMDAYRATLSGAGYSPIAFETEQRRLLEIQQLQEGIARSSFVTGEELARRVALQRETRRVEWVSFPVERFHDSVEVTDAEVEARYEETKDRWTTTEKVDLQYLELKLADLASEVEVDEDALRAFFEEEKAREPQRFATAERRRASHVLVRIDEDTNDEQARERIESLGQRIESGEDFAAVAREGSEDPGSAAQGGDLGWVERGLMVPAFEEALFALEPGTMSEPVKTEYGYHLIRVDEVEAGHAEKYEEAREELAEEFQRRRAEDRFFDLADRLASLTFENAGSLEPAAEALDLEVQTVEGVERGTGPGIAAQAPVRDAAWSTGVLESGENSPLIELAGDHAVVLRVAQHHPAEQRPLEAVAGEIEAELRREEALARSRELGAQARERLGAGETLADVANSLEGDFVGGVTVSRDDDSVPPPVAQAAFDAPRPAGKPAVTGAEGPTGYYVVRVVEAMPGSIESLPDEERTSLMASLTEAQGGEDLTAYLERLRQRAKVSVFDQALQ